ncbi:MAG: non-canonical purine NTP pyrophosphatase [Gemmatimonadetes bacterium]|nr:non-canonical purine NTP pyrophosphatase [Gemmatimonadota bacterium]
MRELVPLLAEKGIAAESLAEAGFVEDPRESTIEAFDTFEQNALAKARWFSALAPGRAVLAEDSGLTVAALDGRPGVRSKRWANVALEAQALDDANNAALVAALEGVADRRACYVCVAVIVERDRTWSARGETRGTIGLAPHGANGFGYDPWFRSDELGVTFAEATLDEKASVSHRARAVRAVLDAYLRADG